MHNIKLDSIKLLNLILLQFKKQFFKSRKFKVVYINSFSKYLEKNVKPLFKNIPYNTLQLNKPNSSNQIKKFNNEIDLLINRPSIVFADLVFGIREVKEFYSTDLIKKYLGIFSDYKLFLIENYKLIFKNKKFNFQDELNKQYNYVNAVIRLPKDFASPFTNAELNLIVISSQCSDTLFAELEYELVNDHSQLDVIFQNLYNHIEEQYIADRMIENELDEGKDYDDLDLDEIYQSAHLDAHIFKPSIDLKNLKKKKQSKSDGKFMYNKYNESILEGVSSNIKYFKGFDYWILERELSNIRSDFTKYKTYNISKVSNKINIGIYNKSFKNFKNSVYIPIVGNSRVENDIKNLKIKHQNYAQVIVNPKIITTEYLKSYLNSKIGKKSISLAFSEVVGVIPRLKKENIEQLLITLPSLKVQNQISENLKKIEDIKMKIHQIEESITINPISSKEEIKNINFIQEIVSNRSIENEILSIIRKGESTSLEFKQSLSNNLNIDNKDKNLETACLKTIVGFLNIKKGGTLLIGVHDTGEVIGLNDEMKKFYKKYSNPKDRICLYFKELVKNRIGIDSFNYLEYTTVDIKKKIILKIVCKHSDKEIFLDGKEFYVRRGPSTEKLEGRALTEHIRKHYS